MSDIKVSDQEYLQAIGKLEQYKTAMDTSGNSYISVLRKIRDSGVSDGEFAAKLDMFIEQVNLSTLKPGLAAENIIWQLKDYLTKIDEADRDLY
jgi:type IV secretory pathway TrbF-like protein